MWKLMLLILLLVLSFFSLADTCSGDPTLSCSASISEVEIGEPLAEANPRDVKKFLGIHALFWAMQSDLYANTPSKVSPQAVSILKNSGVGFIRYGGGVNEIDWHGCVGWVMDRPKQKLVDWAAPMRCIFGLAEYEKLNDELGLSSSWHIANVVGFEGKTNPIEGLVKDAAERAQLIKELSGNRERFWELGNELDRDVLRWSAAKITDRDLPVAKAILKSDPTARIIIPLLEYSPDWVKNTDEHNRYLIKQHKSVASDYALHLYYDNAPWGPSVAIRLASVRNVAKIIKTEGVSNPGIWVTEHARPPPGTPADKGWRKSWYQTGNHDAIVATADFLIGLSQIPMVQGAAWHGQNMRVGPWTFIDTDKDGRLHETRTSRLFELLKPSFEALTLATKTTSVYEPSLSGGYALRAAAFADKNDPLNSKCAVWMVNRSSVEQKVRLVKKSFSQTSELKIGQINMPDSYDPSVSIENLPVLSQSVKPVNGAITVTLPKRSVVLLSISSGNPA